jgi:DNA-binding transcriptional MerR regulator
MNNVILRINKQKELNLQLKKVKKYVVEWNEGKQQLNFRSQLNTKKLSVCV